MEKKVSVIIPVYNVENYIEECLDSLINQTLNEIEIICVDDGSTDGTLELLRKYEAKDTRVKVICQKNQYAGVARNNGMQYATGKYMIFLDADDFFELTMLEKAYNEAERTDAEVVLFGGQSIDDVTKEVKPMPWLLNRKILPEQVPFNRKDTKGLLLNAYSPAPWTKLFKSEFVKKHNLQFQPLQNSNDVFFVFSATSLAEKISYVDEQLIFYRRGMAGSLQGAKKKAPLCFLEAYSSAYKKMQESGVYEEVKAGFRGTVISGCLYNYDSHKDCETKEILLDAFLSDKFNEMDLFGGEKEEYVNYKNYERLKLLVEAHAWKKASKQETVEAAEGEAELQKVSVIIPVNNAEDNIEACIRSLMNQTFKKFEILCVNQQSTDTSWDIIYKLHLEDERIKACWQNEESIGAARKHGLECAQGKYVLFLEPENVLEKKALGKVYRAARDNRAQITLFAGNTFTERLEEAKPLPKCVSKKGFIKNKVFSAAKDSLLLSRASMELWTKMFRKDFLEKENLAEQEFLQETRFIGMLALSVAKKIFVAGTAQVYFKESKQKYHITEQDVREFFDLFYRIHDELQKREVFEKVQVGFKNIVAAESVTIFNRIAKYEVKQAFIKELFTGNFKQLEIIETEEDKNGEDVVEKKRSEQYYCLLGLMKGYVWKERMDALKDRKEFTVLKQAKNQTTPKVSVIVPCYNIEKYVGECLDSLIDQTLKDIEIICVNDGSIDGTKDVLARYAEKDPRITVIEQENAGLSVGRNVGVKNANGEYICFVDSDDLLELYTLEELYRDAKKEVLDIIFFDGDSFFETDNMRERKANYIDYYIRLNDYTGINNGLDLLCAFRKNSEYRQSACMQMVRREFFLEKELWFHPGIYHEDNAFTFKGLLYAERVAHVNRVYYLRRVIENSIMTSKKRFAHSYGYFASFMDMWDIVRDFEFSGEADGIIAGMLQQVINNARSSFRELDSDEKYMFECLDPVERNMFFSLVSHVEKEMQKAKNLQVDKSIQKNQIDELKNSLKNVENENLRLKAELKKIKSSKSYKLAMRVSKVFWKIRNVFKKKK